MWGLFFFSSSSDSDSPIDSETPNFFSCLFTGDGDLEFIKDLEEFDLDLDFDLDNDLDLDLDWDLERDLDLDRDMEGDLDLDCDKEGDRDL